MRKVAGETLVNRLPVNSGVIVQIDFAALRRAGILDTFAGSEMIREPEYRSFVEQTGFDYLRDLDLALVGFAPTGTYFVLRGRFDWRLLREYVVHQGGVCQNAFCRAQGSNSKRMISYFPIERGTMALAVSADPWAASELQKRSETPPLNPPGEPVWAVLLPASVRDSPELPAGTRPFARALEGAERVLLAAGARAGGVELKLSVICRTSAQAAAMTAQLQQATAALREFIRQQGQAPNDADLSGVLSGGVFEQHGPEVTGRWPVPQPFLESLAGGRL